MWRSPAAISVTPTVVPTRQQPLERDTDGEDGSSHAGTQPHAGERCHVAATNTAATLKACSAASWPVPLLADSHWASYFTLG